MTLELTTAGRCTSAEWAKCRLQAVIKADREAVPVWRWVRRKRISSLRKVWDGMWLGKDVYRWERVR